MCEAWGSRGAVFFLALGRNLRSTFRVSPTKVHEETCGNFRMRFASLATQERSHTLLTQGGWGGTPGSQESMFTPEKVASAQELQRYKKPGCASCDSAWAAEGLSGTSRARTRETTAAGGTCSLGKQRTCTESSPFPHQAQPRSDIVHALQNTTSTSNCPTSRATHNSRRVLRS
jgi:hypothetical protein